MKKGQYLEPTLEQVKEELLRRDWSSAKTKAIQNPQITSGKGIKKRVKVGDVTYPSVAKAAEAYGISPGAMKKRINNTNSFLDHNYVD